MKSVDDYIISAGKDGTIRVWTQDLRILEVITTGHGVIKSVDMFDQHIVYLTQKGELYKQTFVQDTPTDPQKGFILAQTHHVGETWGLDFHDNKIYSVGDDNKFMEWDIVSHECTMSMPLLNDKEAKNHSKSVAKGGKKARNATASKQPGSQPDAKCARAVAINEHRSHVAMGYLDGKIIVRSFDKKKEIKYALHEAKEWSEVIRYSPEGNLLAVGSHDNNIYIFDVDDDYSLRTKCVAHSSYIMAFDWSADQEWIKSNCGAYELLFFKIPDSRTRDTKNTGSGASDTKDLTWATETCKLGWSVQGIYPPGVDGTHVNGVDTLHSEKIIITGDDFGYVNIYNYPCLEDNT